MRRSPPLCPEPLFWRLRLISMQHDQIVLHCAPVRRAVRCPGCGAKSVRVHSRYARRVHDLPWSGWRVELVIEARRFFCDASGCSYRIFTEPFPVVLGRYARQTERMQRVLLEMAHASGAEMAARVLQHAGFAVSADTLIRRQRQEGFPCSSPYALGVDDFALRRGCSYGTLLVDLVHHRPLDLLPDRTAGPFAQWLAAHPGVQVIARDRAEAYAHAARTLVPPVVQVADRFHLAQNVGDALKHLLRSRRWTLPAPPCAPAVLQFCRAATPERLPTPRKQALWEAIQEGKGSGQSLRSIATRLGLSRKTVSRYLAYDHPPIYPVRQPQPTKLTPHLAYLRQRWAEGCHNARRLHHELVQRGYRGGESQVRTALHPWRERCGVVPPKRPLPVHWLTLRPARRLSDDERLDLEYLLNVNPALAAGHVLKEHFHQVMHERDVAGLDRWIEQAEQSGLRPFQTVATSFRRDYPAIKAGFTMPWSTGQCEGQITRVKLIKRLGYGRAKLDLLRARVLHRAVR